MDAQMTFKRYELKYMLTRRQTALLKKAMRGHMELDRFGRSAIRNLYLDTDSWRLVRRSVEKPLYKEKMRVRAYGRPDRETGVFVELKKKFESVVYKRRLTLPNRAVTEALGNGRPLPVRENCPLQEKQIAREIEAFRTFYGPTLKPAMFLSYQREAYYPVDGEDFRLTLDDSILWSTEELDLGTDCCGTPLLAPDQVLMELKTPGGLPLWMVHFLSENGIRRISFSKYGSAYEKMMTEDRMLEGRRYA